MRFFDSHTHLESDRFDPDRSEVIARAMRAGVTHIITCGTDLTTSSQGIAVTRSHPGLFAAVGIHAHQALSGVDGEFIETEPWKLDGAAFARVAKLATEADVVAIGEVGLDYHYDFSPRVVQRAVLERQLALACEMNLPVSLHNRDSDEDMRRLVDAAPAVLRGVLHCFLAGPEMARWALARGLHVGIGGPVTFKNMQHLPEVIREVPLDRLLIETDCPYLAPEPKRGRRNEPAYVGYVAEKLAELLGIPLEELARRTTENACRLFGVD